MDNRFSARAETTGRPASAEEPDLPLPQSGKRILAISATGSVLGGIAGAGAATLAILGLAGRMPSYMITVATIVIGAGLFSEGAARGAATTIIEHDVGLPESVPTGEFALQGMSGAAATVLGILGLLDLAPNVLVAVAVLVMGGALALGGPAHAEMQLSHLIASGASPQACRVGRRAFQTCASISTLLGLAAVTLAILTLVAVSRPASGTLLLVALLGLGAARLLDDLALLGRTLPNARHIFLQPQHSGSREPLSPR